ncbi:T9SS type A sorting domain-containing protein, partial [Salibacter halophilus]
DRFVWMETPPPFLGDRWVFTNDTSAVDMSVHGTPDITELPYDSVGILFGVSTSSFLTYLNRYNWNSTISDGINTPYISWYDMGWQKVIDKKVKTPLSNNHNTVSTTIKKTEISNDFGILIGSITGYYNSGTWTSFNLFSQINPDNGETVWDTLVPNDASLHLMSQNKNSRKIVSVGYTGSSNTGIKVWKINLPSIPFQTEFVSDEQDIPGKANQPQVTVYPNPSNNHYNLESGKRIKQVSVYDLRGSVIMQKRIESKRSQIQLEKAGVYLLQIEDVDGNITTKKVVKW